ncbi:MAG: hypothetical protein EOS58_01640 [Mesorhizobium sp.]|uniref:CGNR zinc finger domain-containing protein n=1 Tax=unclassified Mesorhizobium TaxID=325217 RepID=UPI000F763095|nr:MULTISPECIES: CGNR zinc finger domain-containing protein [unclassified Mesorhizobium]AZO52100.1 hypothetical protein EJ073_29535 [Mesorhizobium sp. M4B.F.Ca.ET.058.02.1.1]RVC43671.1 hypothetical protein EN781_17245 [Mesorhizobium sp. M4A.F.Ca.ET.090.04.2.1]RVD38732.1 hypothetical protein EN742_16925 [Mesorhizobium sp. M4A.F.Ca.ET.020.02.1.1]RUX45679.1 hypothetical protein EOA33_23355 [Mesorhizobium sp. M4A.F.Ca.ET.050.02.1.1]RVC76328.1 hypothetical protein EN745_25055 [Mesorhizobium sp. M4A
MAQTHTEWVPEHFIGGHSALDLSNAVFDRRVPAPDNELFKSTQDVANWFMASGLADHHQAQAVSEIEDGRFVERVREVREASFQIFEPIAAGKPSATEALSVLFSCAASPLATGSVDLHDTRPQPSQWRDPDAVTAFLALLSVEAFFSLPRDRLHSCPRCGWLFLDTSRGGKRRWCSMRTCGNREKVSRHRGLSAA